MDVPETGPDKGDAGTVFQYRRRFNLPTGLQATSRVRLRIDSWEGRLESVCVNGVALQIGESAIDAEITDLLEPQNEILLRLGGIGGQAARLSGEVALAIVEMDS